MNKEKDDFFLHSNEVNHINREDYDKIELLVNAAKAFARSTYQCVYIIDYFHQDFIYASDNLAYLCGLEPEQLMEAGYQMYIDHVPDADLQMLLEVNKKGFDLFNELPVGDRLDSTISYDFHLTNGRHSRLIHHQLTPILLLMTEEYGLPSAPYRWRQPMNRDISSCRRMVSVAILNIPHCATSGKRKKA